MRDSQKDGTADSRSDQEFTTAGVQRSKMLVIVVLDEANVGQAFIKGRYFPGEVEPGSESFFPCRSNAAVRDALASTLRPQARIEVAGGIVRHHCW